MACADGAINDGRAVTWVNPSVWPSSWYRSHFADGARSLSESSRMTPPVKMKSLNSHRAKPS